MSMTFIDSMISTLRAETETVAGAIILSIVQPRPRGDYP